MGSEINMVLLAPTGLMPAGVSIVDQLARAGTVVSIQEVTGPDHGFTLTVPPLTSGSDVTEDGILAEYETACQIDMVLTHIRNLGLAVNLDDGRPPQETPPLDADEVATIVHDITGFLHNWRVSKSDALPSGNSADKPDAPAP